MTVTVDVIVQAHHVVDAIVQAAPVVDVIAATESVAYFASTPAPSGFRWDFVTLNGQAVTQNGVPVVDLVRIA